MESDISYLNLNPEIEQEIENDRATGYINPYAFNDKDIIRRENLPHDEATLMRPAFERDIEKILNVPAYNRYSGKTQVFSFVENDDICRRGLHVQLVSRIARNIGRLLGLNVELIEAIALGHDVGHTPFGHAGERYLCECYHRRTGKYFNHNVHSVRVLDQLFRRNISLQTLDGVLCHNGEFAQQQLLRGETSSFDELYSLVEDCNNDELNIKKLRPSTLEGCVVRVSDMIAYIGKDRYDALDMGVIDSLSLFESNVIGKDNVHILNNLTADIVNNSYGKEYIEMSEEVFEDLKVAKEQNNTYIYQNEGMKADSKNIVEEMFEDMYEHLLTDLQQGNENSPVMRHHVEYLAKKSNSISVEEYLTTEPNQIVVDYMASMSDNYFMALYAHLFPQSDRHIITRDYCSDLS